MANDFQIQELIEQNEEGVLFQAVDKQTGHLVALRRFFLKKKLIERLKEEEPDGGTTFEKELEWLRSLEIAHLQKIVGGGFDSLDGTPFLTTAWIEGTTLRDGFRNGALKKEDGEFFETQARAVLTGLPSIFRKAVALQEDEVLFSRDEAGCLKTHFWLSPARFFKISGGEEVEVEESERRLQALIAKFPQREPKPTTAVLKPTIAPTPVSQQPIVIKSARKESGSGVFWCSLMGLILVLGGVVWVMMISPNLNRERKVVRTEKEPREDRIEVDAVQVVPKAELELSVEEVLAHEEIPILREELVAEVVTPPLFEKKEQEEESEEEVVEVSRPRQFSFQEERPVTPTRTKKEELSSSAKRNGILGPNDLVQLKAKAGTTIQFVGTVAEASASGSGKTWYLDFGDRRKQAFVSFPHSQTVEEEERADWDRFVGQTVKVEGVVEIETRWIRGSGVKIVLANLEDLTVLENENSAISSSEVFDFGSIAIGEEMNFKGVFSNYMKREDYVYLFFEGKATVVARFEIGGPLSNHQFKQKMDSLRGLLVRIKGVKSDDPNYPGNVVVHLVDKEDFSN